MRTIAQCKLAFDMMCERALSRESHGKIISEHQMVQEKIADSFIQLEQFRLLVLRTAWRIDRYDDYKRVRADISAVKAAMPKVLADIAGRAIQIHGALGISQELPFGKWVMESFHMGLADGATEVHKINLAQALLRGTEPDDGLFPPYIRPTLRARARERFADLLAEVADDAEPVR